jgi:ComF family protein
MHAIAGGVCAICGERLFSSYAFTGAADEPRCGLCRRIKPPFARAAAYGSYESGLRELIHLLKYGGVRPAANVLGRMLAEAIATLEPELRRNSGTNSRANSVAVIPVPLHRIKLRQRGFNQAELIARSAMKFSPPGRGLRLCAGVLERKRETASQIGLTGHQRRENLRGAFGVAQPELVSGCEVLVVDDVYTTGATVSECARVLRRAGATRVWVATVARTLKISAQHAGIEVKHEADYEANRVDSQMDGRIGADVPMAKAAGT